MPRFQSDQCRVRFGEIIIQKAPSGHHHVGRVFFGRYAYEVYSQGVPRLGAVYVDGAGSRAFELVCFQCYGVTLPLESVPGLYHELLTGIVGDCRDAIWLQGVNVMLAAKLSHLCSFCGEV